MAYKNPLDPRAREQRRKHYHANKAQYIRRNKEKRLKIKEYVDSLKNGPCLDCDETYPPYVMDFDHRNGDQKICGVAILRGNLSWKRVKDEIAKCDLVCSNCHRIRTHNRDQYRKKK